MKNKFLHIILISIIFLTSCADEADNVNQSQSCLGGELILDRPITFSSQNELERFGKNNYSTIEGEIQIYPGIYDLSPLLCLDRVESMVIYSSDLSNLSGLENITEIKRLRIDGSSSLENLEGLESLREVEILTLVNNTRLSNLTGLSSVEVIDEFHVGFNESLVDFSGLKSIKSVTLFDIRSNSSLASLDGLETLDTSPELTIQGSPGEIVIQLNPLLRDIKGLNGIRGMMPHLIISGCPLLSEFGEFKEVTEMKSIVIDDCENYETLDAFSSVEEIFALIIRNSTSLKTLSFKSIRRVGFIEIENNTNLSDISGMKTLREIYFSDIGTSLALNEIPSLVSLNGLENLKSTASKVVINLRNLSDVCALDLLVSNYLSQTAEEQVANSISVRTQCSSGNELINDFQSLCNCN